MAAADRRLLSSSPLIRTSSERIDISHKPRPPISAKALWTMAKYNGMTRGNELKSKLGIPNDHDEKETRGKGDFVNDVVVQSSNPRGILRRHGSISSGRRARFSSVPDISIIQRKEQEAPDFFKKSPKMDLNVRDTRGKKMTEESFKEALQIMSNQRRQSFHFKNSEGGQVQMATKPRGTSTLPRVGGNRIERELQKATSSNSEDQFNNAMIETPRGHGDFERLSSGSDTGGGELPRGCSKGDFQVFTDPKLMEASEKMIIERGEKHKILALQKEVMKAKQNEAHWKEKYEKLVRNMKHFQSMMKIWVPDDSGVD
ncbi:hypothetical protein CAEBREN_08799 [Caenorhabditis brenneri]|uniref:Uncharacterized protein n=1 Tax=Caenorhabditis brenneri TaxID=135651 RepID=G0N6M8_CAEBE|nr:hypothetical protein CAEBREN_08799 [Caenorhabditis brenneri]